MSLTMNIAPPVLTFFQDNSTSGRSAALKLVPVDSRSPIILIANDKSDFK